MDNLSDNRKSSKVQPMTNNKCNNCGRKLPTTEEFYEHVEAMTWAVCPCGTYFDVFEDEYPSEPEFDGYPEEYAWWLEEET